MRKVGATKDGFDSFQSDSSAAVKRDYSTTKQIQRSIKFLNSWTNIFHWIHWTREGISKGMLYLRAIEMNL